MEPRRRALVVAGVALVLLVIVIGVDIAMDRTISLDLSTSNGWVTLARDPIAESERFRYTPPPTIDANGSAMFRIVVDNDYPWSFARSFVARSGATIVAEGTIEAPARGRGVAEFTVNASAIGGEPGPGGVDSPREKSGYLQIEIGDVELYANVFVRGGGG